MATTTPAPVTIRPVCPADAPAVTALAATLTSGMAAWIPEAKALGSTSGWLAGSVERGNDDENGAFVAVRADVVVGFISVTRRTRWYGAAEGNVGELVVTPDLHGHGVGAALLHHAEQWCRDHGLPRIVLQTGAANTGAIGFYQHHGYATEEVTLSRGLS